MRKEKYRQEKEKLAAWFEKPDLRPERVRVELKRFLNLHIEDSRFSFRVVVFVGVVALLVFCYLQYGPGLAKFIAYLIGGAFLYWQLLNSSRRAEAAEETVALAEKGHVHERFKNAIEHLGAKSASVRLGGIYALHNLALDVENYREQVFEILCAHVRETTTHNDYKPRESEVFGELPTIEIQAILNLLFVNEKPRKIYYGLEANLESAHLHGAILQDAHLEDARLANTNLNSTMLLQANLRKAYLYETKFHNAILVGSDMREITILMNTSKPKQSPDERITVAQLLSVKTLYEASLPIEMEKEIQRVNPNLLENPDEKQKT